MAEYKNYDTNDEFRIAGVRLAKDPRVNDGEHGKMVSLTFVSTSRKDKHKEMWWTANVRDFQAEIASFLQKGDTLHEIKGKPVNRPWGDDQDKDSFELEQASIVIPLDLFAAIKERGWSPGAAGKKPTKGTAKPVGKKNPPQGVKKRPAVDIDADDEDTEE